METQETLDKWINSCLNHYNLKSNIKMKTTEERFQQLELAHARLFNQFNTLHQDFISYKDVMEERLVNLKGLINLFPPFTFILSPLLLMLNHEQSANSDSLGISILPA